MRAVLLSFLLLLYPSLLCAQGKVEFVFAYDIQEGFPSFMGRGPDVPVVNPGTYIEILLLLEQRLPLKVKFVRLPWERCKAYLQLNRVSGINSSYRESREKIGVFPKTEEGLIDHSRRITSDTYRLYALEGSDIYYDPHGKQIQNIGAGVVAPLGYSIVSDLKRAGIPIEQNPVGVEGILRMVSLKRAEAGIAHESQTTYLLDKFSHEFGDIRPVDPPIAEKSYFILLSKDFYQKHPALSEQIWDEIGKLRQTHLPDMLKRYMALESSP